MRLFQMTFKHAILQKKETVVVKLKSRKQKRKILINRKNLCSNSQNLSQLKITSKLFISESMCHENHQLAYKCRELKNVKIHSTWFWNNVVSVKLNERSQSAKLYLIVDIEKLLGVDSLKEFLNNVSLYLFECLISFVFIIIFPTFP